MPSEQKCSIIYLFQYRHGRQHGSSVTLAGNSEGRTVNMIEAKRILQQYYGYTSFRSGQEDIIRHIIEGRDTLTVMPTGAGKSICYQIPALLFSGITLVISPLISLMQDQVRALRSIGVRGAYLNSTLTPRQMQLAIANAKQGMYKIIYVAPERLTTEGFLDFACYSDIALIAVDEAHCISQWGHDFRPSYLKIAEFIQKLPHRPVVAAFTATATPRVQKDITERLLLQSPFMLSAGFDRENLYFGVYQPVDKDRFLLDYVKKNGDQPMIIYCSTRKTVEKVANLLQANGFSALPYHAGMSDEDRKTNQEAFLYDQVRIMAATSAFGMGIDKPNVRCVLHYNMPSNLEDYYQQAGRAGRDGDPAECIMLYSYSDVKVCEYFINHGQDTGESTAQQEQFREEERFRLRLMTYYAKSNTCLRQRILKYFGESFTPPCRRCSVCNHDSVDKYILPREQVRIEQEQPVDEALLSRLKKERFRLAYLEGVPAFSVLLDKTLREMAAFKPRTLVQLSRIKGIGQYKLERYGEAFLKVIADYEEESDF